MDARHRLWAMIGSTCCVCVFRKGFLGATKYPEHTRQAVIYGNQLRITMAAGAGVVAYVKAKLIALLGGAIPGAQPSCAISASTSAGNSAASVRC